MFSCISNLSILILLFVFHLNNSNANEFTEEHSTNYHHEDDKQHHRPEDPDLSSFHDHYDSHGQHDDEYDHEAVAGSKKFAEEFKELTPEESKERLSILIDRMDTNKDEKVDEKELFDWIMNSFTNIDKENAEKRLAENDENEDKSIQWGEFVHKNYGYKESELKELENDTSEDMNNFIKMVHEDREKFDLADQNKDGVLSLDEYTVFLHPHNYQHMAPYEIKRNLIEYDKNKDGFIEFDEYTSNSETLDPQTLQIEKSQFDKYDINKDGKLDKDEIVQWVIPGFSDTAKHEVEHLIKETDVDGDKLLTKNEILAQVDLWVGSHATDYGKHLDDLIMKTEL